MTEGKTNTRPMGSSFRLGGRHETGGSMRQQRCLLGEGARGLLDPGARVALRGGRPLGALSGVTFSSTSSWILHSSCSQLESELEDDRLRLARAKKSRNEFTPGGDCLPLPFDQ